ncbi:MAG TPA: hypothetical protein VF041_06305 [Gemmatimonadaceae bacterium]
MTVADERVVLGEHRLANDRYAVRLTKSGGGASTYAGLAITRFTPDPANEGGGSGLFIYLRDLESGAYWSAGFHPTGKRADRYVARTAPGRVTIEREDDGIRCTMEVCVCGGADAELRRLTIENASGRARRLDVTTYAELVLNTAAADAAHPAFSKLFVQTEWYGERQALLARRRARAAEDEPLWVVHLLRPDDELGPLGEVSWETDRMRFLGRGRTAERPRALDRGVALSGSTGNVLDPVFSLRRAVTLASGARAGFVVILGAGRTRADAEAIAARFDAAREADDAFAAAAAAAAVGAGPAAVSDHEVRVAEFQTVPQPESHDPYARAEPPPAAVRAWDGSEALRFFNGYGGFSRAGDEYVIRLDAGPEGPRWPPLPWTNVIANERAGFIASESGAGCTWSVNSRENRLTPWYNDPVSDPHGEALWVRDEDAGVFWSPMPGPTPAPEPYEVRHGFGYTTWRLTTRELDHEVTAFVPREDPVKIVRVRLQNRAARERHLSLTSYARLVLGSVPWETAPGLVTTRDEETDAILATNASRGVLSGRVAFAAAVPPLGGEIDGSTSDRAAFLGPNGSVHDPIALCEATPLDGRMGAGLDACAALRVHLTLDAGETVECAFLLGEGEDVDEARALVRRYREPGAASAALEQVRAFWRDLLSGVRIETPSPELDLMVNGWLAYQNLSCRMWGRSAFYQSGGAFGFRDQLQDAAALVYLSPAITRAQLLLHAAHQFVEGDVLHWWHPPASAGMRTRFADDLLWLPYVAAFYVERTGDAGVLDEEVPFIAARALSPDEDEVYLRPRDAGEVGTLYEHCRRAIDRSLAVGAHGLPLMGTGDWNDGMNRVGREGRGESVWLGFFLFDILGRFATVAERRGDGASAERWRAHRERLGRALEDAGWDGEWYRRAYYDDGTPLGSAASDECRIDTIAQAWAVLSRAAPPARAARALGAMERHLVSEPEGIIRLLTPAFDRTAHDPGYIKGYLPGVRENGGQYTHGALWGVRALAELGLGERAAPLLAMLSPVSHARTAEEVAVYRAEPYVIAADVYGVAPHVGRGGWTWYTGSAGWMYRVALESVLGVGLMEGDRIELRPCIPASWPGFSVRLRRPDARTHYEIVVRRAAEGAPTTARADGGALGVEEGAVVIPLHSDGATHRVEVELGRDVGARYEGG